MKSLKIHGPLDLRIEDYPVDNLKPNQVLYLPIREPNIRSFSQAKCGPNMI